MTLNTVITIEVSTADKNPPTLRLMYGKQKLLFSGHGSVSFELDLPCNDHW